MRQYPEWEKLKYKIAESLSLSKPKGFRSSPQMERGPKREDYYLIYISVYFTAGIVQILLWLEMLYPFSTKSLCNHVSSLPCTLSLTYRIGKVKELKILPLLPI